MKKYINKVLAFAATVLLLASCSEDPKLTKLEKVIFPGSPDASVSEVIITKDNLQENVLALSWDEVTYPVPAPVTYSLQLALPADTLGDDAWKTVEEIEMGDDVTTGALLGTQLNEAVLNLGIESGDAAMIAVRVKSYMDRPIYSKSFGIKVTPYDAVIYPEKLYIAGDYQGWNIGAATVLERMSGEGRYEGYIYLPPGGTNEFKLYAQPDWSPMSYGDGGNNTVIIANFAGANFHAPSDGYYLFAVDLNLKTYILIKTTWGIIGGATPAGWDSDTQLTYNPDTKAWSVTADMKQNGSFKFRANNGWQIDFGLANGNPGYANHPWLTYVEQPHFTVPSDGNYTITLDLHLSGNYQYSIVKN